MNNRKRVGVILKGGLGNQLFQIAAGIHSSPGQSLEIFSNLTTPRKTGNIADALYFDWPKMITENPRQSSRLERKVLSLSLKQALVPKSFFNKYVTDRVINLIADIAISWRFKTPTHIISGSGVGFCAIKITAKNSLLNGYFQAHQYPSKPEVNSQLQKIKLKNESVALLSWIEKAKLEAPIIVHLRLGDYKNESAIGILTPEYYKKSLELIELSAKSLNLWIFTDEEESVGKFISPPSKFKVRIIGEIGLSPAETLELMRYGSAYVIANSTFSWWAAFLSYQSGCTKIMPSPWFLNMASPVGIKPNDWIAIEYIR